MKKRAFHILAESLGWYGVFAILGAYAASTLGFVGSSSPVYQWLNLTGAIGIAIDAYHDHNVQPVVLNVIWALVALIALIRSFYL